MANKISKHVSYKEGIRSSTADRMGLDNTPDESQLKCMKEVAENLFEPLREWVGGPIKINSFFRGEPVNTAIGGSTRSQHMKGQAIDIDDTFGHKTNAEMYHYIKDNLDRIENFHYEIKSIPTNQSPFQKIVYIGKSMKYFYILYESYELENLMSFTFGFHGYIDTILGINKQIVTKKINPISFTKSNKFKLKNMYYPNLKNPVKNSIDISKNYIVTGPNAAGKTTLIKSAIINLLLSQQIGYGYFDGGKLGTFKHIHCYLNIPDSCSRDSLFQAEARRCKNIIDKIEQYPNDRHFCIFDELYSGTNPYEAISSAYSYLTYISRNKNVKFLLTTHFIRLCNLLEKHDTIVNKSMKTSIINNDPNYSYKIVNGISKIKGGVCVLKQLNYPQELIDNTNKVLEKL